MEYIAPKRKFPTTSVVLSLINGQSTDEETGLAWHHLGAPRPTAKTGRSQVCFLLKCVKIRSIAAQTPTKNTTTRITIFHFGIGTDQRKAQLRPYG
jgi:hypothetical protein